MGSGWRARSRRSGPDLPILLATGYSEAAQSVRADFPILRKPYQMHELSRALAEVLPGDRERRRPTARKKARRNRRAFLVSNQKPAAGETVCHQPRELISP